MLLRLWSSLGLLRAKETRRSAGGFLLGLRVACISWEIGSHFWRNEIRPAEPNILPSSDSCVMFFCDLFHDELENLTPKW